MLLAQHLIINQRPIAAFSARLSIDFLQVITSLGAAVLGANGQAFRVRVTVNLKKKTA
jgi:hypothetical protein